MPSTQPKNPKLQGKQSKPGSTKQTFWNQPVTSKSVFALVCTAAITAGVNSFSDRGLGPWMVDLESSREVKELENSSPVFKAVAQYEPEVFERLQSELSNLPRSQRDTEQVSALSSKHISPLLEAYLPLASDEVLIDLYRLGTEGLLQDAEQCRSTLIRGTMLAAAVERDEDHLEALMGQAITSGATNPQTLQGAYSEQIQQSFQSILPSLEAKHGQNLAVLDLTDITSGEAEVACEVYPDFYQAILQLPASESSRIFRAFLQS